MNEISSLCRRSTRWLRRNEQARTNYQGEEDPDFVIADDVPPIADPTDHLKLDVGKPDDGELPAAPSELVPCFESNTPVEAKLVADELAAEGIRSALQNTVGSGQIPAGVFSLYPCLVVVEAGDLDRAGRRGVPGPLAGPLSFSEGEPGGRDRAWPVPASRARPSRNSRSRASES